jgi:Tfp pilus assembly protein PilZ
MLQRFNPATRSQDSAREQLLAKYSDRMSVNPVLTRSLVSFQGNKNKPFVGWLKYKEAFSSEFVRFALETIDTSERRSVLFDPFAGSATALFAAAERGWNASGTELLPIGICAARARAAAQRVNLRKLSAAMCRLDDVFARYSEELPFPHLRITRGAFPKAAEKELSRYRAFVANQKDVAVRTLLDFAALCVLEDISFTRKDGQYLRWDNRSNRNLASSFNKGAIYGFRDAVKEKLRQILSDVRACGGADHGATKVNILPGSFLQRAFEMNTAEIDLVITSPPYCNRYDYTRTYALELAYLGLGEEDVRNLRQSLLSATVENRPKVEALRHLFSVHNQGERFDAISQTFQSARALHEVLAILEQAADEGHLNNPHIPRMVRNYFFEMAVAISHLSRLMRSGGLVVMVNDNVRYFGEEIPVDLLLAFFAENLGFCVEKIWILPRGKGNSSQQMGVHGRSELRKCVYIWRST